MHAKCHYGQCSDPVLDINFKTGKQYHYCIEHRKTRKLQKKQQYIKFKDKYIAYGKKSWQKLKFAFLELYGGQCECCQEKDFDLLTMDHINGGGKRHRKEKPFRQIYKEAIDCYQPNKYRVLCYNCNFCIGMNGSCLHKNLALKEKHSRLVFYSEFGNGYYDYNRRVKFLDLYGRKCAICGQKGNVFLTLDHIHGDGCKDRQSSGNNWLTYKQAIQNVDHSKYQTLCCNCNMSRKYQGVMNYG